MNLKHRQPSCFPLCYCRDRSFSYLSARLSRRLYAVAHVHALTRSENVARRSLCRFAVLRNALHNLSA